MLTAKNVHALRTLFNCAHRLAPLLGPAWLLVLDNLNRLDAILHSPRTTTQVRPPQRRYRIATAVRPCLMLTQTSCGDTFTVWCKSSKISHKMSSCKPLLTHPCWRTGLVLLAHASKMWSSKYVSAARAASSQGRLRRLQTPDTEELAGVPQPARTNSCAASPGRSRGDGRQIWLPTQEAAHGALPSELAVLGVAAAQLFEATADMGTEAVVAMLGALRTVSMRSLPAAAQLTGPPKCARMPPASCAPLLLLLQGAPPPPRTLRATYPRFQGTSQGARSSASRRSGGVTILSWPWVVFVL